MSDLRWIILIKIISEGGGGGGTPYNVLYTEARPEKEYVPFSG